MLEIVITSKLIIVLSLMQLVRFCLINFIDNLVLMYTSSLTDTIMLLRNMNVLTGVKYHW